MGSKNFDQKPYSKIRHKLRAHYDRETILPLLDLGIYAHVSFIQENKPMVIPMIYARKNDTIVFTRC